MRRLVTLACAIALTVPVLSSTPASAVTSCSVQANWSGTSPGPGPFTFTGAVNCPTGTDIIACSAVATVVAEVVANQLAGVPWIPATPVLDTGCGNSFSTTAATDTNPISGSRHITAVFVIVTTAEDPEFVAGGDTALLACVPDIVANFVANVCVANSTSYFKF